MTTSRWLVPPTEEERRVPFRIEVWLRAMPLPQRIITILSVALLTLLLTFWMVAMIGLVHDAWDPPVRNPDFRREWDYFRDQHEYELRPPKDVRDAGAMAVAQEMKTWSDEVEPTNVATNK